MLTADQQDQLLDQAAEEVLALIEERAPLPERFVAKKFAAEKGRGAFSVEKAPRECPRPTKATKDISCRCYLSVLTELES